MNIDDTFRPGLLEGHRILITGGGTGLGRGMAEKFLSLGAELYICGRRLGVVEETALELMAQFGGKVTALEIDIRNAEAVDAMIERVFAEGPLTGLVNNAAGNFISRTEDLSHRGFDAIANIVMHGTFYVTQAVGKRWIKGGHRGSVVSVIVTWVTGGGPFVVPSTMSKSAIEAMTKSLATEWGRFGIRLNAIGPGKIPTEGMSKRLNPTERKRDDAVAGPMARDGEMAEMQNLATFLISDGCPWLTGQSIMMDGGAHLANGGNFHALASWTDQQWLDARAAIETQNSKDRAGRTAARNS